MIRGNGAVLRSSLGEEVSPEMVRDAWVKVTDMTNAKCMESVTEATGNLVQLLDDMDKNAEIPTNSKYSDKFSFSNKDLILYALGGKLNSIDLIMRFIKVKICLNILNVYIYFLVGATVKDSVDLKYLYENHPEFSPLPSFFILPGLMLQMSSPMISKALTHTEFNLTQVLHGEQYLEVVDDLPTEGELTTNGCVIDVIDKRSGAVVVANCKV